MKDREAKNIIPCHLQTYQILNASIYIVSKPLKQTACDMCTIWKLVPFTLPTHAFTYFFPIAYDFSMQQRAATKDNS